MKSRRVLLVCYYFPPLGGAGVGRPLALYKNLPDFNIECDVLTVKPVAYRWYEPELLDGIEGGRIYRAGSMDPQRLMYLLGVRRVKDRMVSRSRGVSDRFFPDPKAGWVRRAVKLGRVITENRGYDCVVSTSPPMSCHLVASSLADEFKLPWVADFRDFWTGYKAEDWFDSGRQVERAQQLLEKIRSSASQITVTNPAIAEYLGLGEVIYNSFDEKRASLWKPPVARDKFVIGVLGTIDELRPIEPLFKVLAAIREREPGLFEHVRVIHVGTINLENLSALIEEYSLKDVFETAGFQKRERTIEILSETSMLYIGLASPHGRGVLPGRIFDMIASGRPLLAAAETGGVLESIVSETGNGFCFDDNQIADAASYVVQHITDDQRHCGMASGVAQYAEEFSSKKMVEHLVEVLDRLC